MAALVRAAIAELPTGQRDAVPLYYLAGDVAIREVRVSRLVEHTFYGEVVLADGTGVDAPRATRSTWRS